MSKRKHTTGLALGSLAATVLLLASCGGDPNSPGVEYMPDMYRSPAVEAYVDYGQDPYHYGEDVAKEQRERQSARLPAAGTIPFSQDPAKAQFNMPYPNAGFVSWCINQYKPIFTVWILNHFWIIWITYINSWV